MIIVLSFTASAMETQFLTTEIKNEEQVQIWNQMNPQKISTPMDKGKGIISFAVNQYGTVAIVFQLEFGERIDVYDANGTFCMAWLLISQNTSTLIMIAWITKLLFAVDIIRH